MCHSHHAYVTKFEIIHKRRPDRELQINRWLLEVVKGRQETMGAQHLHKKGFAWCMSSQIPVHHQYHDRYLKEQSGSVAIIVWNCFNCHAPSIKCKITWWVRIILTKLKNNSFSPADLIHTWSDQSILSIRNMKWYGIFDFESDLHQKCLDWMRTSQIL